MNKLVTAFATTMLLCAASPAQAAKDPLGDAQIQILKAAEKIFGKANARKTLRPLVYAYIQLMREMYKPQGKPLTAAEITELKKFFPERLLTKVTVTERADTGLGNQFASATTYGKFIIIKKGKRSPGLLKHEMVHVCQYDKLGIKGFADQYANQFVDGGYVYRKIKFEEQAYEFAKTGTGPVKAFLGYCE
jgi:hypothetical protein